MSAGVITDPQLLASLGDRFAEADAGLGIPLDQAYGSWRRTALEREVAKHQDEAPANVLRNLVGGLLVGIFAALCAKALAGTSAVSGMAGSVSIHPAGAEAQSLIGEVIDRAPKDIVDVPTAVQR